MAEIKILLDLADFRKLVAGRFTEVEIELRGERHWVKTGLQPMGYRDLEKALHDAITDAVKQKREAEANVQKESIEEEGSSEEKGDSEEGSPEGGSPEGRDTGGTPEGGDKGNLIKFKGREVISEGVQEGEGNAEGEETDNAE